MKTFNFDDFNANIVEHACVTIEHIEMLSCGAIDIDGLRKYIESHGWKNVPVSVAHTMFTTHVGYVEAVMEAMVNNTGYTMEELELEWMYLDGDNHPQISWYLAEQWCRTLVLTENTSKINDVDRFNEISPLILCLSRIERVSKRTHELIKYGSDQQMVQFLNYDFSEPTDGEWIEDGETNHVFGKVTMSEVAEAIGVEPKLARTIGMTIDVGDVTDIMGAGAVMSILYAKPCLTAIISDMSVLEYEAKAKEFIDVLQHETFRGMYRWLVNNHQFVDFVHDRYDALVKMTKRMAELEDRFELENEQIN